MIDFNGLDGDSARRGFELRRWADGVCRPHIPIRASEDLSEDLRAGTLLFYDFHLLFVHATATHLELGQSTGDLFQVFCGQGKFGGFDVLLEVLDLARSRDGTMNGFWASSHASDNCAVVALFSPRKLSDAIDKWLIRSHAFRLKTVKP